MGEIILNRELSSSSFELPNTTVEIVISYDISEGDWFEQRVLGLFTCRNHVLVLSRVYVQTGVHIGRPSMCNLVLQLSSFEVTRRVVELDGLTEFFTDTNAHKGAVI